MDIPRKLVDMMLQKRIERLEQEIQAHGGVIPEQELRNDPEYHWLTSAGWRATSSNHDILVPVSDTETVIEILSGPKWDGKRWVWTFFMNWWDNSPTVCGKCGRSTHFLDNESCGHPEAKRYVRSQIHVTSLEQTEKRILEGGRSVRYIRDGKTIGSTTAKATT